MTRCQLMRGTFDHPWIPVAPQHIAACEVQPEEVEKKQDKDAGVEFISLKITKQRPSGGLVCSLSLPVKTCLTWPAWKTCKTASGITPEGEKKRNHQTICFCAQSPSSYAQDDLPTGRSCFLLQFCCYILCPLLCGPYGQCNFNQHLIGVGCCPSSVQSVHLTRKVNNLGQQMAIALVVHVRVAENSLWLCPGPSSPLERSTLTFHRSGASGRFRVWHGTL